MSCGETFLTVTRLLNIHVLYVCFEQNGNFLDSGTELLKVGNPELSTESQIVLKSKEIMQNVTGHFLACQTSKVFVSIGVTIVHPWRACHQYFQETFKQCEGTVTTKVGKRLCGT